MILRAYGGATGNGREEVYCSTRGSTHLTCSGFLQEILTKQKVSSPPLFWNIPVEDNAFALLRNSQNQVAMIHASSTHWKNRYSLEICLENGYITIKGDLSPNGDYGPREELIVSPRPPEMKNERPGSPKNRSPVLLLLLRGNVRWMHLSIASGAAHRYKRDPPPMPCRQ